MSKAKKSLTARVPKWLMESLERYCVDTGRSRTDAVTELMIEFIAYAEDHNEACERLRDYYSKLGRLGQDWVCQCWRVGQPPRKTRDGWVRCRCGTKVVLWDNVPAEQQERPIEEWDPTCEQCAS